MSTIWSDGRQRAALVSFFYLGSDSRRFHVGLSSAAVRLVVAGCSPSDVAFPSGDESLTPEISRRPSFRRAHVDPGAVVHLSPAPSSPSKSPSRSPSSSSYGVERAASMSAVSATHGRTKYGKNISKICHLLTPISRRCPTFTSYFFKRANVSAAPAAAALL